MWNSFTKEEKNELNYSVTFVWISGLMHQNRVSSSHSTLEICSRQFQTVNILCKLLRRLHVKTTQQIQPIINYWLTHSLQNLIQMYFTNLTISILKIIPHIPRVTASPLTHGLQIFYGLQCMPSCQIYDTN